MNDESLVSTIYLNSSDHEKLGFTKRYEDEYLEVGIDNWLPNGVAFITTEMIN